MASPVKDVYLIAYNLACASGWGYVLFVCVSHILAGNEPQALYDEVEKVLQIVQTAALMEVLHAMLGVVRSPWVTTLMQVSSRIVLVWGFMWAVPSTQGQLGSMLCITSWACVEIPRYLFYTFGVLKSSPYPLFYLRYSLFAVLYPTGIAGEVMTMLAGLPDLKNAQDTLRLGVGPVSVSGYIVTLALLAVYVPGGPYMYMNMVGNRRSAFKKRNAAASKKA
ncbi:unnamed protein product [Ectocarpus fasciculatus]